MTSAVSKSGTLHRLNLLYDRLLWLFCAMGGLFVGAKIVILEVPILNIKQNSYINPWCFRKKVVYLWTQLIIQKNDDRK